MAPTGRFIHRIERETAATEIERPFRAVRHDVETPNAGPAGENVADLFDPVARRVDELHDGATLQPGEQDIST